MQPAIPIREKMPANHGTAKRFNNLESPAYTKNPGLQLYFCRLKGI